jgi:DNA-binding IclR family transcriptional regulator
MERVLRPNKAKTARRVIEILEYFDDERRHATVMDIARRYQCPQSSTSELLAMLVEIGLLYKDPTHRHYTPTPRAAMLGSLFQPSAVRDGRLSMLTDRLVAQTGLGTAVIGMVGLKAQIFRWMKGAKPFVEAEAAEGLSGGFQEHLCGSAAGWLLLSTVPEKRREGMIRRLRAEATENSQFDPAELRERVRACAEQGFVIGPAGFGSTAALCAVLLPGETDEQPMVLGFAYEPSDEIDPQALVALLQKSVQSYLVQPANSVTLRPHETGAAASVA